MSTTRAHASQGDLRTLAAFVAQRESNLLFALQIALDTTVALSAFPRLHKPSAGPSCLPLAALSAQRVAHPIRRGGHAASETARASISPQVHGRPWCSSRHAPPLVSIKFPLRERLDMDGGDCRRMQRSHASGPQPSRVVHAQAADPPPRECRNCWSSHSAERNHERSQPDELGETVPV